MGTWVTSELQHSGCANSSRAREHPERPMGRSREHLGWAGLPGLSSSANPREPARPPTSQVACGRVSSTCRLCISSVLRRAMSSLDSHPVLGSHHGPGMALSKKDITLLRAQEPMCDWQQHQRTCSVEKKAQGTTYLNNMKIQGPRSWAEWQWTAGFQLWTSASSHVRKS